MRFCVAIALWFGDVAAAPATHERVAIIDLGPRDPALHHQLAATLAAAGLDVVTGDRLDEALAGESIDSDAIDLAAAMADAQREFGALDCKRASAASEIAISLAAQRQAADLPVPELPRALAYVLLCADRAADVDTAMTTAARLRAIGGSPDVPAEIWNKYPDIDAVADRELVALEITADTRGAVIWVDFQRIGTAPARVELAAGHHVIAAANGPQRGWAAGRAVASQKQLMVPTRDQRGEWLFVAQRVASWRGARPSPTQLGWVMANVRARVALVRSGDTIEAFGRIGVAEPPRRIGGDQGIARVVEAERLAALIVERTHAWNDRAPDPDRPLLLDDAPRGADGRKRDAPTRWWVYASIVGAIAAGAVVLYANDAGGDRQRVELHQP